MLTALCRLHQEKSLTPPDPASIAKPIMSPPVSKLDRVLGQVSANCLVCNLARRRQRGLLFWLVKHVENRLCPFCRAYERVFGRKSHEPVPQPVHEKV